MYSELISVIIPVYNAEKTLTRCVNSILSQSYNNIEVILVNDGSSDNSGTICDHFSVDNERIKVIHTQNSGASAARNIGVNAAEGDFIAFADSDDYTDPLWLEHLMDLIKRKNTDISVCGYTLILPKKNIIPFKTVTSDICINESAMFLSLIKGGCGGFLWNKLFRAEIIKNHHFDETIHFCEDLEMLMRCLNDGASVAYTSESLYFYCKNSGSVTESFSEKNLSVLKAYSKSAELSNITPRIRRLLIARRAEAAVNLLYKSVFKNSSYMVKYLKKNVFKDIKIFFLCKDISLYEKIRFLIKLCVPKMGKRIYLFINGEEKK